MCNSDSILKSIFNSCAITNYSTLISYNYLNFIVFNNQNKHSASSNTDFIIQADYLMYNNRHSAAL